MILQEDFNLINSKNYNTILFYKPIKIYNSKNFGYCNYKINIKGIKGFPYLKDKNYNLNGDIQFISKIPNPILSYFLLEDINKK